MVDLVKIRKKKAAKAAEESARAAAEQAQTATQPADPPEAALAPVAEAPLPVAETTTPEQPATEEPPASTSKLERFKAEAGKRRETEIVRAEEETTGSDRLELLTFLIAGEQYAVDIERIVEIVTPRIVTRIPNADESVLGIMSLRGTIVTLLDVRRKLHHAVAGAPTDDTRVIVVELNHETVGFVVDKVLRVVKTTAAEIEAHPVVHSTELSESVRGVFRVAGALTILLDLDKLLDHSTLSARTA